MTPVLRKNPHTIELHGAAKSEPQATGKWSNHCITSQAMWQEMPMSQAMDNSCIWRQKLLKSRCFKERVGSLGIAGDSIAKTMSYKQGCGDAETPRAHPKQIQ
jgi:hypothetical protein